MSERKQQAQKIPGMKNKRDDMISMKERNIKRANE